MKQREQGSRKKFKPIFVFSYCLQIIVPCCLAVLIALSAAEDPVAEGKKETKAEPKAIVEDQKANESSKNQKRGIFGSIGDYGHDFGGHSYGGHSFGGHDFGGHDFGASEHHHEHIKTITIEKKIPVPYTVTKHVPYTVEKKVPYEVKVSVPQPYIGRLYYDCIIDKYIVIVFWV